MLSKALDISGATALAMSDLLKTLVILPDTTVRKSAVDQEDLKPYWKSLKRPYFLDNQQSYYLQIFQRLYHRMKTKRAVVFS